jgi:hypothetical protein
MAWERRLRGTAYYTRSRKVGGLVVRQYIGAGPTGELAAQLDALERERRETERAAWRAEKAELEALDAPLDELNDWADLLARAVLTAAGFRQHHRGEWRRRRAQHDETR